MCGLLAGVAAVGAEVTDIGVVTTPELHFTVQTYNQYHALEEQAYFTNLLESFRCDHTPNKLQPCFLTTSSAADASCL
jgi:phosphomannomutase